ncbi:MAG: TIGR02328 family protein [Candidatus Woesearchaeota archaeon]
MRLWHQDLLDKLPRQQLLGQHRECCALRGNGWNKNHSTVDYVFENPIEKLIVYHLQVMNEMLKRGHKPNIKWRHTKYRGKNCEPLKEVNADVVEDFRHVYQEHDEEYLQECIDNLAGKGCVCRYIEDLI